MSADLFSAGTSCRLLKEFALVGGLAELGCDRSRDPRNPYPLRLPLNLGFLLGSFSLMLDGTMIIW